jgi:hypothetical protein
MARIRWPKTKTPVREVNSKYDSPFTSDKCKHIKNFIIFSSIWFGKQNADTNSYE